MTFRAAAHIEFDLDELTSRNLTGKPLGPETTITVAGFGRAPGIAKSLKLAGRSRLFPTARR